MKFIKQKRALYTRRSLQILTLALSILAFTPTIYTERQYAIADFSLFNKVNHHLGFPNTDTPTPSVGQSMTSARWLSHEEITKIALYSSIAISIAALVIGIISRLIYGYHFTIGYGIPLSLATIFYSIFIFIQVPLNW